MPGRRAHSHSNRERYTGKRSPFCLVSKFSAIASRYENFIVYSSWPFKRILRGSPVAETLKYGLMSGGICHSQLCSPTKMYGPRTAYLFEHTHRADIEVKTGRRPFKPIHTKKCRTSPSRIIRLRRVINIRDTRVDIDQCREVPQVLIRNRSSKLL